MPYLEQKWGEYRRERNPARRYSNQREFEADWVNGLRRRYRLSQEALAVRAGVSVTTVQNWENPQSRKNIADHNQDRLRDIERDLWIKAHVTLLEPCPAPIRAIHDLLAANRDDSARGLADYLAASLSADDPERARVLHWACLAHGLADPVSARAREYAAAALNALADTRGPLSAAIENEILGARFEDLLAQPEGPERRERGADIVAALERLYARDRQPAYLWNALETACLAPLDTAVVFRLVSRLSEHLGAGAVQRRIANEDAYRAARALCQASGAAN